MTGMEQQRSNSLVGLPGAIIIAAAIIAVAIIWANGKSPAPSAATGASAPVVQINMKPVSTSDHVYGNPDAPVKIVEYSDPSCPFCKMFNSSMEQIMTDYGPSGKVAWIYRQFPLDKPDQNGNILHPLAGTQAEGMECAAALGGNDAFWKYEQAWFSVFPSDGADESPSLSQGQMDQAAAAAGLDKAPFDKCVADGRFKDKIDAEYADGLNAGVTGTPYSVIITPSGTSIPRAGAMSYATLKAAVDALLSAATSTGQQ